MSQHWAPKSAFYFLRHGETDWNRAGKLQGATDIPLNGLGVQQAARAAAILKSLPISRVLMSHLIRVRQTAAPLLDGWTLSPEINPGLAERRYGVWEGKTHAETDGSGAPEGGETRRAFNDRVIGTLSAITPTPAHEPGLLIIAHSGVFRAIAEALEIELERGIGNAEPVRIECGAQGRWRFVHLAIDADTAPDAKQPSAKFADLNPV